MRLNSGELLHSKSQEALKEKENQLEKLRVHLRKAQGSFEEEMKKLKGQIGEIQDFNMKRVSSISKYK